MSRIIAALMVSSVMTMSGVAFADSHKMMDKSETMKDTMSKTDMKKEMMKSDMKKPTMMDDKTKMEGMKESVMMDDKMNKDGMKKPAMMDDKMKDTMDKGMMKKDTMKKMN